MVGPIEILPPLNKVPGAGATRARPVDPVDRPGATAGRPSPIAVVIDVDPTGASEPRISGGGPSEAGGPGRAARRARAPQPIPERRALYGSAHAGAGESGRSGTIAYRSADNLVADFARRGTFVDLTI